MQSREIAERIQVPAAETAKILQLLVWGGFVNSRRGSKGGFRLASSTDRITMGAVIEFFLTRHAVEPEKTSPVMRTLHDCLAPCQKEFARLSLAEVTQRAAIKPARKRPVTGGPKESARASGGERKIAL